MNHLPRRVLGAYFVAEGTGAGAQWTGTTVYRGTTMATLFGQGLKAESP